MNRFYLCAFLLITLKNCVATEISTSSILDISDGEIASVSLSSYNKTNQNDQAFTQLLSIKGNAHFVISVNDIPSEVSFIIVQIHTYLYNVTMSYDKLIKKPSGNFVTGSNIGLFYETSGSKIAVVYVSNDNSLNIEGLIAVVAYTSTAPYPGGCNMEFDIEKSPFQKIAYDEATVTVNAQPAAVPKIGIIEPLCEKYPLRHDAYRIYMPEQDFTNVTYFTTIASMLTVEDIEKNANRVPAPLFGSSMRRIYSAYAGVGSVYGMIARFSNYSSAYVPIVSYGCDPISWNTSCTTLSTPISKVVCAFTFFMGLLIAMRGYYYFKTSMFFIGMVIGGYSGYILGVHAGTLDNTGVSTIAVTIGVLTSFIWLLLWVTFSSPIPSLILSGLTLGSFFFFVFYYVIPGGILYLEVDAYFWLLFVTFIMLTIVLLSVTPISGNILCFTALGAYASIFAIDYYSGSNLKYIIINGIRRATVPVFNVAVIQPPYQDKDILLTAFWIFIVILGLCKQCANSWERAPFPPPILHERTPLVGDRRSYSNRRRRPFFTQQHNRYTYVQF